MRRHLRLAAATLALAVPISSACAAPVPAHVENCQSTSPATYWVSVGGTDCSDAPIRIYTGDNSSSIRPTVTATRETDDGRYSVTIISSPETSFLLNTYHIEPQEAGVEFDILRVVRPDEEDEHTVTLILGSDTIAIESIGLLGEIAETDDPANDLAPTPILILGNSNIDPHVTGSVGFIAATEMLILKVDGDLGSVDLAPDVSGAVISEHINTLEVGGDLMGTLAVTDADGDGESIASLTIEGRMGLASPNPMNPAHLAAGDLRTEGSIGFLATSEVGPEVEIEVGDGGDETIGRLEISTEFGGSGDFHGSLVASTVENGAALHHIRVRGDLYGTMEFMEAITNHDEVTPVLIIGGSFKEGAQIIVPEDGLAGQIVINGNDDGGAWEAGGTAAEVIIGSGGGQIVLNEPMYELDADAHGGGSAGPAPFTIYWEETTPPDGEFIVSPPPTILSCDQFNPQNATPAALRIAHYGPITCDDASATNINPWPVKLERKAHFPESEWEELERSDGDWKVSIESPAGRSNSVLRCELIAGGGIAPGYTYRVRPYTSEGGSLEGDNPLKCRAVAGEPDVAFWTYSVRLVYDCEDMMMSMYDLNDDELIDSQDIGAWISAPVDLNQDAAVDLADLDRLVQVVNY